MYINIKTKTNYVLVKIKKTYIAPYAKLTKFPPYKNEITRKCMQMYFRKYFVPQRRITKLNIQNTRISTTFNMLAYKSSSCSTETPFKRCSNEALRISSDFD